jgi:hypothetical protein
MRGQRKVVIVISQSVVNSLSILSFHKRHSEPNYLEDMLSSNVDGLLRMGIWQVRCKHATYPCQKPAFGTDRECTLGTSFMPFPRGSHPSTLGGKYCTQRFVLQSTPRNGPAPSELRLSPV